MFLKAFKCVQIFGFPNFWRDKIPLFSADVFKWSFAQFQIKMGRFHPWRIPSEIVFRLFHIKIFADVRGTLTV